MKLGLSSEISLVNITLLFRNNPLVLAFLQRDRANKHFEQCGLTDS